MSLVFDSLLQTMAAILDFFGQKEIIGILVGALGTLIWYRFKSAIEQNEKNKRVVKLLKGNLERNAEVAQRNIAIVENEQSGLPERFTLDPLAAFHPTSADLLLLTTSFGGEESLLLWNQLKEIDSLANKFESLAAEAISLKHAIKTESRQEIIMFELNPYLQSFDKLIVDNLLRISHVCRSSMDLVDKIQR